LILLGFAACLGKDIEVPHHRVKIVLAQPTAILRHDCGRLLQVQLVAKIEAHYQPKAQKGKGFEVGLLFGCVAYKLLERTLNVVSY
jgi:hypothetical protein